VHVMPYSDTTAYHVLWSDVVLIEGPAIGQTLEPIAEKVEAPVAKKSAAVAPKAKRAPKAKTVAKAAAKKAAAKKAAPKAEAATEKKPAAKKAARKKTGE
jgi:hypothetical protein